MGIYICVYNICVYIYMCVCMRIDVDRGKRVQLKALLGCLKDLVSRLRNGPDGASYGLLRGLKGDMN